MPTPLFPKPFRKIMEEAFTDKEHPAYGQVATIDEKGLPQVRTVHLRYMKKHEIFAFATNVQSPKWRQLQKNQFLSGCYFDDFRQIQFRWESPVELVPADAKGAAYILIKEMWGLVRAHIRAAYWLDHEGISARETFKAFLKLPKILKPCPTFGIVLCRPTLWDIYEVMPDDVLNARRSVFRLKGNEWEEKKTSLLHGD